MLLISLLSIILYQNKSLNLASERAIIKFMYASKLRAWYLLVLVCLFFLITRIYKISEIPGSVYWDEASIGYNAYSVALTGKDEWGEAIPKFFKAFGETKLPIYIYTVALTTKFFGLNEFSLRLPAVLFSLGTIILVFFLSKSLFENTLVGLFSSFLLTISPWFFIFSRTGYEATAGLFFFIMGIFLWLEYRRNKIFLIISSLSFILSIYSYNAFIILSLLVLPILFIWLIRSNVLKKTSLLLIVPIILITVGYLPMIVSLSHGSSRLEVVGIFNNSKPQILKELLINYTKHFNPGFLFLSGDVNLRSQQKGFGQIYIIEVPFLIIGIIASLRKKRFNYLFPVYVLFISTIPAAITKESPHALRSILAAPFISLISAFGISLVCLKIKKGFRNFFYPALATVFLIFFANYDYAFLRNYNKDSYNDWQYGYKKIFLDYSKEFKKYNHIIVSDRYNQPYIFALFYLKYDPNNFRDEVFYNKSIRKATSLVSNFSNFIFTDVNFYDLPKGKNLIFTTPSDRMDEIKPKDVILNPDKTISIYIYEYEK